MEVDDSMSTQAQVELMVKGTECEEIGRMSTRLMDGLKITSGESECAGNIEGMAEGIINQGVFKGEQSTKENCGQIEMLETKMKNGLNITSKGTEYETVESVTEGLKNMELVKGEQSRPEIYGSMASKNQMMMKNKGEQPIVDENEEWDGMHSSMATEAFKGEVSGIETSQEALGIVKYVLDYVMDGMRTSKEEYRGYDRKYRLKGNNIRKLELNEEDIIMKKVKGEQSAETIRTTKKFMKDLRFEAWRKSKDWEESDEDRIFDSAEVLPEMLQDYETPMVITGGGEGSGEHQGGRAEVRHEVQGS